jgi:hypothetical protein
MQEDWNDSGGPSPSNQAWAATLAYTILVTLNAYPDAMRLAAGSHGQDDDFWGDNILGWQPSTAVAWNQSIGGSTQSNSVVRCARVPYLVGTRRGAGYPTGHTLDHLLVGYTDVQGSATLQGSWNMNSGGHSLSTFGAFLVGQLWPGQSNTCRYVDNWKLPASGATYGYTQGSAPSSPWQFRERSITPDATARITVTDNSNQRRYLLVGYEGGGGW